MQELISVQLTGHDAAFPLHGEAHAELTRYLSRARNRLAGDPDSTDILSDLEHSIGDRLDALDSRPDRRFSAAEMLTVLAQIGEVEESDPAPSLPAPRARAPRGRFLCRIRQGKWFGGLCLGLAAYGDFNVDWVRTIFILLGLATGGLLFVVYLITLLFVPLVDSVADYELQRDTAAA